MSYIDDLKEVFGDTLPSSHIFFATMANKSVPSYQALRKAMGVTTAKENTALYKKLVAEYNAAGPIVPALAFSTNLTATKTAVEGTDATFSVVVTGGKTPYTYKWYKDDVLIAPASNATASTASLKLTAVDDTAEASYKVVVNDSDAKTITSASCALTVTPTP